LKHYDYMMQKQENTITEWHELMQLNGMFKDLEKIKAIQEDLNKDGEKNE